MTSSEMGKIGGPRGRGDAKRRSREHYVIAGQKSALARKLLKLNSGVNSTLTQNPLVNIGQNDGKK